MSWHSINRYPDGTYYLSGKPCSSEDEAITYGANSIIGTDDICIGAILVPEGVAEAFGKVLNNNGFLNGAFFQLSEWRPDSVQ